MPRGGGGRGHALAHRGDADFNSDAGDDDPGSIDEDLSVAGMLRGAKAPGATEPEPA